MKQKLVFKDSEGTPKKRIEEAAKKVAHLLSASRQQISETSKR